MKTVKNILAESSKNIHLEHLEDEIFNLGSDGIKKSIAFLSNLRSALAGNSKSSVDISVKWDGAPAIVCGTDPKTGVFFVGTKSVFNKESPKINYTIRDIEVNHAGADDLIDTLKIALENLSKLNIKGVVQGDVLFKQSSLKFTRIDNQDVITFQPNTITYAVGEETELGNKIKNAKIGVVFHTRYIGNDIPSMRTSFGANANEFSATRDVWVTDATFRDESGTATLTQKETQEVTNNLAEIRKLFAEMDHSVIDLIASHDQVRTLIKLYVNSQIRAGSTISRKKEYVQGLVGFIDARFQKEIDLLKTEKGKKSKAEVLQKIKDTLNENEFTLVEMFTISELITQAKLILLRKLETVKSLGTFIKQGDSYKVTAPEGFVAIDKVSGHAVKLVDRLEFSKSNFDLNRAWNK